MQICDAMKMTSSADFDYDHNGHYLHYNETQWVGFDDQTSAMIKVLCEYIICMDVPFLSFENSLFRRNQ